MRISKIKTNDGLQLCIDGVPLFRNGTHLCGTPYNDPVIIEDEASFKEYKSIAKNYETHKFPHPVKQFSYNGFFGELSNELAAYTAKFKSWSGDPGVAHFECSDGETRLIPTFAIVASALLPPDETKDRMLFGTPCES